MSFQAQPFHVRPHVPKDLLNIKDVHPATLQAFGCYVLERRLAIGLSQDVLASSVERRTEWIVALEKGELSPTTPALLKLNPKLAESDDEPLLRVLNELHVLPWGNNAATLRRSLGLNNPPASFVPFEDNSSSLPLVHESDLEERLLIVTPLLIALVVAGILYTLGVAGSNGVQWAFPQPARSIGLAAVAMSVAGATSPLMGRIWGVMLWPLRQFGNKTNLQVVKKVRSFERVEPSRNLVWTSNDELQHLAPRYRAAARAYSIRAEINERLALIALGAAVATGFAWIRVNGDGSHGWMWLAVGSLGLGVLFHLRAIDAGAKLVTALIRGFGRRDDWARRNGIGRRRALGRR